MPAIPSLSAIRLVNYKGFADHRLSFRETNVLIGANNAGKSTALGALRLIAAMLPTARRTHPTAVGRLRGIQTRGWPITAKAIDISSISLDNVRHDFRQIETRIEVTTNLGATLIAAWPAPDPEEESGPPTGMFFVTTANGSGIQARVAAQTMAPTIAVVPTLSPLDDRESSVSTETLRRQIAGRRSSRYFRNALDELNETEWAEFTTYVYEQTPEIGNLTLKQYFDSSDDVYDLFYEEADTRHEREIGWAGDGIQIWIQVLFHIWRQREAEVLVLDEPDVFLHPDLQRRLARLVYGAGQQAILATHSVEILAEAEPGSAVWIDRSRRNAERPRTDGALAMMGRRLGSGFELGVGRALRSRTVLFVEGDDAPILALLAQRLGHRSVATSDNYATVPLGGFSRNWRAGAFAETMETLGSEIRSFVILDSDLRTDEAIERETSELKHMGTSVHVWLRRELENYLLSAATIAKAARISKDVAEALLEASIEGERDEAALALDSQRLLERGNKKSSTRGQSEKSVLAASRAEFRERWSTETGRLGLVDAKRVIRALNHALQQQGSHTVNPHTLARSMPANSIPSEVQEVLTQFAALIDRE